MKLETEVSRGLCLYVRGQELPRLIVGLGTVASPHVASPVFWVLCPEDEFHVMPIVGLVRVDTETTATWRDPDGQPVFVIARLADCEEVNTGEALAAIDDARRIYETPPGAEWLRQQLTGAAQSELLQVKWQG